MSEHITAEKWDEYLENGYLKLGRLLTNEDLAALQRRIDDIMLGRANLDYDKVLMQRDGAGTVQTKGFKGATLEYRKIQDLELDDIFLAYMKRPLFQHICGRVYGSVPISTFRAMFMNKPAAKGTVLPWHQDRWNFLDRDPLLTVWTALDPATIANGCVRVIRGSHHHGPINPDDTSGFLTAEQADQYCPPDRVTHLELAAGEAVLLHNWLLHSSDVNHTDHARRAFSVCYMDARTAHRDGSTFPKVF